MSLASSYGSAQAEGGAQPAAATPRGTLGLEIEALSPALGAAKDVSPGARLKNLLKPASELGRAAHQKSSDELFYRLGDAIRWRLDDAGRIPPWAYFEGALQGAARPRGARPRHVSVGSSADVGRFAVA